MKLLLYVLFCLHEAKQTKKHKTRQTIQGGGFNINGNTVTGVSQTASGEVNISDVSIEEVVSNVAEIANNINVDQLVSNIGGTGGGLLEGVTTLLGQLLGVIVSLLNSTGLSSVLRIVLGLLGAVIELVLILLGILL